MSNELDTEQKLPEINDGMLICLEGVNKTLNREVLTTLNTALKYEIKDQKFVTVNPYTCTPVASNIANLLNQDLDGSTRLVLTASLISEAVNIIRANITAGNHVICTSYTTEFIIDLSRFYTPMNIVNVLNSSDLIIPRSTEIVLMSEVPSDNEIAVFRLHSYNDFINGAINDKTSITKSYRVEANNITTDEKLDDITNEVILIIKQELDNFINLKKMAVKMFAEDTNNSAIEQEDITE